jgi:trk system potassium uptake protein TrkH
MNPRLVLRTTGMLLMLEALAMAACGLFALLDVVDGVGRAAGELFMAAGMTAGVALAMIAAGGGGRFKNRLTRRDAVLIVGLGWVLSGLFGALPFLLCPPHLGFSEALFESVSGLTTTGGTVIPDLTLWPRGVLLWRAVTNWLGGIGILVLFVMVLSRMGVGGKSLFMRESSFRGGESGAARVKDNSLMLLKVYLLLTAACAAGLRAMGLSWFNAVTHAFAAIATGGFSPHNASVGHYSKWGNGVFIEVWLGVFMLLSGVNFVVYVLIAKKRWERLREHADALWFLALALGSALLIAAGIAATGGQPFPEALRGSFFVVASAASCCGFSTADYDQWPAFGKIVLAALMIIGGCAGSTAGGIKVGRFVVFLKSSVHEVIRSFRPNQVFRLRMGGRTLDDESRREVMVFIAMFGFIIVGSTVVVALLENGTGITMETAVGSVLACISNVGPGFDAVGPTENFSQLRAPTQVFLSWVMILGRLELFALLVLFVPGAWRKY